MLEILSLFGCHNRMEEKGENESEITDIEMDYLQEHMKKLIAHPLALAFLEPVDPEKEGLPNYFKVIKDPMDLGTVKGKLDGRLYKTIDAFLDDLNLVWANAIKFNGKKSLLKFCAERLQKKCARWFEIIPSNKTKAWELEVRKRQREIKSLFKYCSGESEVPILDSLRLRFHQGSTAPKPV